MTEKIGREGQRELVYDNIGRIPQGQPNTDHVAYWQRHLVGVPTVIDLPTDYPRPSVSTSYPREAVSMTLPASLRRALELFCRQERLPLSTILLTAFGILLSRYSGQNDFVIGVSASNCSSWGSSQLATDSSHVMALRVDLSGDPICRSLLNRVHQEVRASLVHAVPLETMLRYFRHTDGAGLQSPFSVLLTLGSAAPEVCSRLPEPLSLLVGLDLALQVEERTEGLGCHINFRTDLFETATIRRMIDHWRTLLEGIVADREQSIARLPILTEAEQQQILVEWNATQAPYPQDACVHHLFEEQVQKTPDAIAAISNGDQLTYRQLNERANQVAHYLRGQGVGPDVLVGVCVPRSLEMVVGVLGILKAGGAYVPLDPAYPGERLAFMLADAHIPILITVSELESRLPTTAMEVLCLDRDWPIIAQQPTGTPLSEVTSRNLVYVLYTSGSTGRPKGTLIQHQGVVNYLHWCCQAYQIAGGVGAPVQSSLSFDATVTSFFGPLVAGKTITLLPEDESIEALSAALSANATFSLLKITPAHLELLNRMLTPQDLAQQTCVVVIGGETLRAETLAPWRKFAPGVRLINEYGPTETVVGCCVYEVTSQTPSAGTVLIGRPIANTQLYILDESLQPVPIGVVGELYIGGAGLARGYLNRPDLTAERFIQHPFSREPGARVYKTGDQARYRSDGTIEYLGRLDHQVKIRGFRIELGEIEAVLAQYPAVREAVVLAREESSSDKRLVAYVVLIEGEAATEITMRRFLQERLPSYMIPAAYVVLEKMPLTPNGKVDRRALPAPKQASTEPRADFLAPRTPTEERLAAMWAELLDLQRVGVTDNFIELGGHSLMALQFLSQVQEQFQVELPLKSIFETPTIQELAIQIEQLLLDEIAIMSDEEAQNLLK